MAKQSNETTGFKKISFKDINDFEQNKSNDYDNIKANLNKRVSIKLNDSNKLK